MISSTKHINSMPPSAVISIKYRRLSHSCTVVELNAPISRKKSYDAKLFNRGHFLVQITTGPKNTLPLCKILDGKNEVMTHFVQS